MNKEQKSNLLIAGLVLLGSVVQFVRGKTIFGAVGLVIVLVFIYLTFSSKEK